MFTLNGNIATVFASATTRPSLGEEKICLFTCPDDIVAINSINVNRKNINLIFFF